MTLDEIEKLAVKLRDDHLTQFEEDDLASAVMAMLPIVRAAERYTDTAREMQVYAKRGLTSMSAMSEHDQAHRAIQSGVDAMRGALEGK